MKSTSTSQHELSKKEIYDGCQGAHWFEPTLLYDNNDQLKDLAPELLKILYGYKCYKRYRKELHEEQAQIFLNNALPAYWYTEGWVTIPVKTEIYSGSSASARIFNELIINGLVKHSFLIKHRGYNNGLIGRVTRYRMTQKFNDWISQKNLTPEIPKFPRPKADIVVKDSNGNKIALSNFDAEKYKQLKRNLDTINDSLEKSDLSLDLTSNEMMQLNQRLYKRSREDKDQPMPYFTPTKKFLYRTFNNSSFGSGGRFYRGFWQSLPKEYRSRILIDDEPTVEADFKCMHSRILYALEGEEYLKDIYHLDGIDEKYRELTKQIFLKIYNAKSLIQTRNSVRKSGVLKNKLDGKFPKGIRSYKDFISCIERQHPALAKYFYTGVGLRLQNIDSRIAESIMLRMIKEHDTVALCVHDSFIVKKRYKKELIQVMQEEYKNETGCNCPIELKN
jgi:hypothetical protein